MLVKVRKHIAIDKSGIEEMTGEREAPEMKVHGEVVRLRICLR